MKISFTVFSFFSIVFVILSSLFIATQLIPKAAILWDESVFLFVIYQTVELLRHLSFAPLFHELINQFNYGPVQAFLTAPLLALTGFSIEGARYINVLFYSISCVFMTYITKLVTKKPFAATLAIFFMATSPLVLYFASIAMKEMLGAMLILCIVSTYCRARETKHLLAVCVTAIFLILLYLTKYHFAVFAALPIGIEFLILIAQKHPSKKLLFYHVILFLVPLLVAIIWISFPTMRIAKFLEIMTNKTVDYTGGLTDTLGYLLFYPRAVLYGYSPSVIIGFLYLSSLIWSFFHLRQLPIRIMAIMVASNMLLVGIHTINLQNRYIFITIPCLFILCSLMITDVIAWTKRQQKVIQVFLAGTSLCILVIVAYDLYGLPRLVWAASAQTMHAATFDQLDYKDKWFSYDTKAWPYKIPKDHTQTARYVTEFIIDTVDPYKPVRVVGLSNEFSQDYFNLLLAMKKSTTAPSNEGYSSYTVTVRILPDSPRNSLDFQKMIAWMQQDIPVVAADPRLTVLTRRTFQPIGVEVTIYVPKT